MLTISLIIALAVCIFFNIVIIYCDPYLFTVLIIGMGTAVVGIGLINQINSSKEPSALDVYRGRTELKISGEYEDSTFIPKDSIVVFK